MKGMSKIFDKINEFAEPVKNWLIENDDNPLLWLGILIGGLLLFYFAYLALRKEH